MANPEMSDQMPDSPPIDDSPVAEASPAALANETAQLQRLLAEAKDGEREARRALSVLASIIKHLPVGVTASRCLPTTWLPNFPTRSRAAPRQATAKP
jgi:hypothetical protein